MIRRAASGALVVMLSFFSTSPVSAIVGGSVDGTTHSFVGAVDLRLAGLPIVASGVLVSPSVLVTAGHVTRYFDRAGQTRARVTFDPVVSSSSTWYWGTVHTNPAFTTGATPETQDDPNDLGVIVFDEAIPGITPALLPTENVLDQLRGQDHGQLLFEEVGYGVSRHVGGAKDQGLSSFVDDGTRRLAHGQFVTSYGGWLQVQPLDGHVCFGDSGGPVLLGNVAVGIHKANANGGSCTGVAFDMRLDTVAHRAFLGHFVTLP